MIKWIERAKDLEGCFVEIGLGVGNTTNILIKEAESVNKTVIGIDPFSEDDAPRSYTLPYSYDKFMENVGDPDNFILIKQNSMSKVVFDRLLDLDIALAFIDGLQYYGAVLSDLSLVKHAQMIILDDYNRSTGVSQVKEAVEEFLKHNKFTLIDNGRWAILIR